MMKINSQILENNSRKNIFGFFSRLEKMGGLFILRILHARYISCNKFNNIIYLKNVKSINDIL